MLRDLFYSALYYLSLWAATNIAALLCGIDLKEGPAVYIAAAFTVAYYYFTVDRVVDSVTEKQK